MSDLLQHGSRWLEDQRHQHMTRPIAYFRGAGSVTLQATVGKTVFDQQDQFGVVQRTESRDFLVRAVDLTFAGQQTLPRAGDRIVESGGPHRFFTRLCQSAQSLPSASATPND